MKRLALKRFGLFKNYLLAVILSGFIPCFADAGDILYVGDSLSCTNYGFAPALVKELKRQAQGGQVDLYCAVSSSPTHWIKGVQGPGVGSCMHSVNGGALAKCGGFPKFSSMLAQRNYSRVVVALGTNSVANSKIDANYNAMAAAIGSRECQWIGPPHFDPVKQPKYKKTEAKLNGFYSSMCGAMAINSCKLVDSRPATQAGTPGAVTADGIHRGNRAGQYWAEKILPELGSGGPGACVNGNPGTKNQQEKDAKSIFPVQ